MSNRVAGLRSMLEEPLLVSNPVNLRYLTGFESSNAALLVEPDRLRLFTDFRYAEAARGVPDVEVVETRRNLFAHLGELLSGPMGFEAGHLSYDRYEVLAGDRLDLVPRRRLVETLRASKDEEELELIRRAAAISDEAFERLAAEPFAGQKERDLAWRLSELFHELGAGSLAFEIIVASGPNAALPHARPTDRIVGAGETVIVDAGCTVGGYCSDCTRTFASGELPAELGRIYEVCLRAQEAGIRALAAGEEGVDVDRAAREVIEAEGYGNRFGHGLGHGIGLDVHEAPWLHPEFPSTLTAGNVVTVEPGIYLPGLGGVRIEDLVALGDEGTEVLTSVTRDLLYVH